MVRFTGHPGGVGFFRGKGGSFLYEFGFGGGFAIEDFEEGGYGLGAAVFWKLDGGVDGFAGGEGDIGGEGRHWFAADTQIGRGNHFTSQQIVERGSERVDVACRREVPHIA